MSERLTSGKALFGSCLLHLGRMKTRENNKNLSGGHRIHLTFFEHTVQGHEYSWCYAALVEFEDHFITAKVSQSPGAVIS